MIEPANSGNVSHSIHRATQLCLTGATQPTSPPIVLRLALASSASLTERSYTPKSTKASEVRPPKSPIPILRLPSPLPFTF